MDAQKDLIKLLKTLLENSKVIQFKREAKYVFVYVQKYTTNYNWYFNGGTLNELNSKINSIKPAAELNENVFLPNVTRLFKDGDKV